MTSPIKPQEAVTRPREDRFAERPAQMMAEKMDKAQEIFDQYVAPNGTLYSNVDLAEAKNAVDQLSAIYIELSMSSEGVQPMDLQKVDALQFQLETLVKEATPDPNRSVYREQDVGLNDIVNGERPRSPRSGERN